ncbi:MAG: hypothetical protein OXC12_01835 [Spirochaetaceae bacterium]|nr:hypothetical protein [Spirochaetaceae bacterium]
MATMVAHGIRTLVTENGDDFTSFDEIETMAIVALDRTAGVGGQAEQDPKATGQGKRPS